MLPTVSAVLAREFAVQDARPGARRVDMPLVCLCGCVRDPGIAELRSIRVTSRVVCETM